MIIDATNMIVGRLATVAAKKALMGEKVEIINSEKAIVSGRREMVFARFRQKYDRGAPLKGPYYPRMPERLVKRTIRGMLPWTKTKGREAYKRITCYIGVPDGMKGKKAEAIKGADASKLPTLRYITIEEVSKNLGARWQK